MAAEGVSSLVLSEATLGTTTSQALVQASPSSPTAVLALASPHANALPPINSLPSEIMLQITNHLTCVEQMCLALTGRVQYAFLHSLYGGLDEEGKPFKGLHKWYTGYNILIYPFNLQMQYSLCGEISVYGRGEWWAHLDDHRIAWAENLGWFLYGENWLWGERKRCECCFKYKPTEAFGGFEWEEEVLKGCGKKGVEVYGQWEGDEGWKVYIKKSFCRRCRVREWMVCLLGREHFYEYLDMGEEPESLGLEKVVPLVETEEVWKVARHLVDGLHAYKFQCLYFDRWEDIFEELGI